MVTQQTGSAGGGEDGEPNAGEGPIPAPALDRRRGDGPAQEKLHAESMYVREYDRGRMVRNTPIQRPEVILMLASLIGENQAIGKRKVRLSPRACTSFVIS
jgi:hypothetical protein